MLSFAAAFGLSIFVWETLLHTQLHWLTLPIGSSGGVVFTAAFVLAFTMLALLSSNVINIGRAGLTICMGLILDMLMVRLFLVMRLARVLGPWFWWPQSVRWRSPQPRPIAPQSANACRLPRGCPNRSHDEGNPPS